MGSAFSQHHSIDQMVEKILRILKKGEKITQASFVIRIRETIFQYFSWKWNAKQRILQFVPNARFRHKEGKRTDRTIGARKGVDNIQIRWCAPLFFFSLARSYQNIFRFSNRWVKVRKRIEIFEQIFWNTRHVLIRHLEIFDFMEGAKNQIYS